MECARCALNTLEVTDWLDLLEEATSFYTKYHMADPEAWSQVEVTGKQLVKALNSVIYNCQLPAWSPVEQQKERLAEALKTRSIPAVNTSVENLSDTLRSALMAMA